MKLASNIEPGYGFLGGVIMGIASSMMMYFHGKISGMSGIVSSAAIFRPEDDKRWVWGFVGGAIVGGIIFINAHPSFFASETELSTGAAVVAGLLTGFGTRLGSGCTTGHGICGLPRQSPRSLAAVGTFMFVAVVSAILTRETGLKQPVERSETSNSELSDPAALVLPSLLAVLLLMALFSYNRWLESLVGARKPDGNCECSDAVHPTPSTYVLTLVCGLLFGVGLSVSGMCDPARVIGFLDFIGADGWDPTLMFVMAGGVLVNALTFYWMSSREHPPLLHPEGSAKLNAVIKFQLHPDNLKIDKKLLIGSAMFGAGWGLGGICPGPAVVGLGAYRRDSAIFVPAMLCGFALHEVFYGTSVVSVSYWMNEKKATQVAPPAEISGDVALTAPAVVDSA